MAFGGQVAPDWSRLVTSSLETDGLEPDTVRTSRAYVGLREVRRLRLALR